MHLESTISGLLAWAKIELNEQNSAAIDARVLLCHCAQITPSFVMTWPEKVLPVEVIDRFRYLVGLRKLGHPIAYLVGYRDFWTLRLKVSEDTLIPRPETELLVEQALALHLPSQAKVLDLGTGTGAIALALASERSNWQVKGVDFMPKAVALAQDNAQQCGLTQVQFSISNWFAQIPPQQFDLIVSNPPYVESDSPYLSQGDVRFEPLWALISGESGLDDIAKIIPQSVFFCVIICIQLFVFS